MEDVVKVIKLPLDSSWSLFQYCIAEMIGCHKTLRLGYKLSTEQATAKPHSLKTVDEYEGMQEEFLLELKVQVSLLKKKSKKTTKVQKPLKVSIINRCSRNEKKVQDLTRDKKLD